MATNAIQKARDLLGNYLNQVKGGFQASIPGTQAFGQQVQNVAPYAKAVGQELVNTGKNALQASYRLQGGPQIAQLVQGKPITSSYQGNFGQQLQSFGRDLGAGVKAAGAFTSGLGTQAIGGAFGLGMGAIKDRGFQNGPQNFASGVGFTQQVGPIGSAVGGVLQNIKPASNLLQSTEPGLKGVIQRIIGGVGKEGLTGVGFGALTGENPISSGLQFAPYGVLGAMGENKGGNKSNFAMDIQGKRAITEASYILDYPEKFVNENLGHFPDPVAKENAIKVAIQTAKETIDYYGNKHLPKDVIDAVGGDHQKMVAKLLKLNSENKLTNRKDVMGLVGDTQPQGVGATKAISSPLDSVNARISDAGNLKPESIFQTAPGSKAQLPGQTAQPNSPTTSALGSSEQYIKELTQKQNAASRAGGVGAKVSTFLSDLKAKLVDTNAPIEDALASSEKQGKFNVLPKNDVRLQIDRVLRSKTLASQFAEDNGLVGAIKSAPDINALDQYMIAKQAKTVGENGIVTGRDPVRDQQLINDLGPTYEPIAKQVNNYSRVLLDYVTKAGLISPETQKALITKYPDYVPLNRIFGEGEQPQTFANGKSVASLSSQSVVQKIKGSERAIRSPIESMLLKTQDAFSQGERNIAARQLASYKDLPGFQGLIKEAPQGQTSNHTFSYLDNGVKKTFDTTPEIAAAAKNLNQEQMGLIGKILSTPTRILQVGATGLNIPFTASNLAKDEVTSFINSKKALSTSIANPVNFTKALFAAVGHNDLYDEVVRNAAGGTSFDIARDAPNLSVQKIRNPVGYTVRHPLELLRAVEDIVGRSEELGRVKNYKGTYDALIKEGRTPEDARLLAGKAARQNTTDFARHGSWSRVLNWMIPFFNAGIQGSRQLMTGFRDRPVQTVAKLGVAVFTPIAAVTAWNLSDPQRRQVYQDIPDFEKQGNIVIVPPNPVKNKAGQWQVIKVPLSQEVANLGSVVRRVLEQAQGLDPVKFSEIASALITTGTSLDLSSPNKLASTLTPQIIKPVVEGVTNTNLYTGRKIVPDYLSAQPAKDQVRPTTSGTARLLGGLTNVSPLKIENAVGTVAGGLGRNILNASDTLLNKAGVIPSQQVGGESIPANLERRFSGAQGGSLIDKLYNDSNQLQTVESQVRALAKDGKQQQAIDLIKANKPLFAKAAMLKLARSEVDKLTSYRTKIIASNLSSEKKKQALDIINQRLYKISVALYAK